MSDEAAWNGDCTWKIQARRTENASAYEARATKTMPRGLPRDAAVMAGTLRPSRARLPAGRACPQTGWDAVDTSLRSKLWKARWRHLRLRVQRRGTLAPCDFRAWRPSPGCGPWR